MSEYYDRAGNPLGLAAFKGDRAVGKTTVDDADVSTVFLGLNHRFGDGPPLIFETMIFGGEHDQWQDRYSTEQQAQDGHTAVVAWLRGEGPEPS